jgi:hypothetical protein
MRPSFTFYVGGEIEPLLRQIHPYFPVTWIEGVICLIGTVRCKDSAFLGIKQCGPHKLPTQRRIGLQKFPKSEKLSNL